MPPKTPSAPVLCLGVDPGSLACGWAVVSRFGSRLELVEAGVIRSARGADFDQRILGIHLRLSEAIERHHPQFMAVESPFVEKNAATALKLGQIRGGILLTAGLHRLPVGDYNPMQVKKAVSGYGWADKTQVGKMVQVLLSLKEPLAADASDAAAVAIGHLLASRS
ncbi:crossover junction endodeoxyribonuclease RuvC [Holophaga foetida]|uniref:crossover junction endodeoxyribonuclease RuvC n=1 Tax=Holophaga foetida TaxID=35839 RepID=UPI0005B850F6|nr:crossover junction endodeoxyribonuclease RuvC [Holophaga foetida]